VRQLRIILAVVQKVKDSCQKKETFFAVTVTGTGQYQFFEVVGNCHDEKISSEYIAMWSTF
jgi:hypothetical protein